MTPDLSAIAEQLAAIQRAIADSTADDVADAELVARAHAAAERMRLSSAESLPAMFVGMRKRGARVLGPYQEAEDKFRIVEIDARGKRDSAVFETAAKAERYKELVLARIAHAQHTTETALAEYRKYLVEKGNKPETNAVLEWAIEQFFPTPIALDALTPARCAALYDDLRTRPMPRTKAPLAADTHRSVLARAKAFVVWCMERRAVARGGRAQRSSGPWRGCRPGVLQVACRAADRGLSRQEPPSVTNSPDTLR